MLQRLAAADVDRPLACTSGNPAAAGSLLLRRAVVRYHGDFDWPGIVIARRIIDQGAQPWRLGCADYCEAAERWPAGRRLMLTGRAEINPWDSGLSPAMMTANVAEPGRPLRPGLTIGSQPASQVSASSGYRTSSPVTARPMIMRWISDVPSKMVKIFASRCQRSTGKSRV